MKRRGSIYLVVLMSTLLVVVMALLGMELAGRSAKSASIIRDGVAATNAAESGVNYALTFMQQSNWRSNAATLGTVVVGDATASVGVVDDFGSLVSSTFDPVRIKVTGARGNARVLLEADAQAAGTAPAHFGYVLYAGANLTLTGATVTGTGNVRTDGNVSASSSTIQQNVAAHNLALGSAYQGGTTLLLLSLSAPDIPSMIAAFQRFGTSINRATLDANPISKVVVGPQVTPWGTSNRFGVYVLDCNGSPVTISNSRIEGTLVLINASSGVTVSGSMSWKAAVPGYPIIISDGPVTLSTGSTALTEASLGVNLNPPGTGVPCNTTMTDSYVSQINGLVLVKDRLTLGNALNFRGVLVATDKVNITGTVSLTYDSLPSLTPPPGLGSPGAMSLLEGGMRRITE